MIKRILSSIVYAAINLTAIYMGGVIYILFLMTLFVIAFHEWMKLKLPTKTNFFWIISGLSYIVPGFFALFWLRLFRADFFAVLYVVLIVWAVDSGAYLVGSTLGGPKLMPRVSPKKTWAGLMGGMMCAGAVSFATVLSGSSNIWLLGGGLFLGIFLAGIAQAGDLFESWIKRCAGVKDSGALIPGHGGILDRIDGLLFAAPIWAIILWMLLRIFPGAGI